MLSCRSEYPDQARYAALKLLSLCAQLGLIHLEQAGVRLQPSQPLSQEGLAATLSATTGKLQELCLALAQATASENPAAASAALSQKALPAVEALRETFLSASGMRCGSVYPQAEEPALAQITGLFDVEAIAADPQPSHHNIGELADLAVIHLARRDTERARQLAREYALPLIPRIEERSFMKIGWAVFLPVYNLFSSGEEMHTAIKQALGLIRDPVHNGSNELVMGVVKVVPAFSNFSLANDALQRALAITEEMNPYHQRDILIAAVESYGRLYAQQGLPELTYGQAIDLAKESPDRREGARLLARLCEARLREGYPQLTEPLEAWSMAMGIMAEVYNYAAQDRDENDLVRLENACLWAFQDGRAKKIAKAKMRPVFVAQYQRLTGMLVTGPLAEAAAALSPQDLIAHFLIAACFKRRGEQNLFSCQLLEARIESNYLIPLLSSALGPEEEATLRLQFVPGLQRYMFSSQHTISPTEESASMFHAAIARQADWFRGKRVLVLSLAECADIAIALARAGAAQVVVTEPYEEGIEMARLNLRLEPEEVRHRIVIAKGFIYEGLSQITGQKSPRFDAVVCNNPLDKPLFSCDSPKDFLEAAKRRKAGAVVVQRAIQGLGARLRPKGRAFFIALEYMENEFLVAFMVNRDDLWEWAGPDWQVKPLYRPGFLNIYCITQDDKFSSPEAESSAVKLYWPYSESPYQVLGVGEDATQKDIRQAYVGLVKKYHPLIQGQEDSPAKQDAQAMMVKINLAAGKGGILSDEDKRKAYDKATGRATSGFLFAQASQDYPGIRQAVLNIHDDWAVHKAAAAKGYFAGFDPAVVTEEAFSQARHAASRILAVLGDEFPELLVLPIYMVLGLDRAAEYLPGEAIIIDIRAPPYLVNLALIDEITHHIHLYLPAAEQELLAILRQSEYAEEILDRFGLSLAQAQEELRLAGLDLADFLGFLVELNRLPAEERRAAVIAWANAHQGVFGPQATQGFLDMPVAAGGVGKKAKSDASAADSALAPLLAEEALSWMQWLPRELAVKIGPLLPIPNGMVRSAKAGRKVTTGTVTEENLREILTGIIEGDFAALYDPDNHTIEVQDFRFFLQLFMKGKTTVVNLLTADPEGNYVKEFKLSAEMLGVVSALAIEAFERKVQEGLVDSDPYHRQKTVELLGFLADQFEPSVGLMETIRLALLDEAEPVRRYAAWTLGMFASHQGSKINWPPLVLVTLAANIVQNGCPRSGISSSMALEGYCSDRGIDLQEIVGVMVEHGQGILSDNEWRLLKCSLDIYDGEAHDPRRLNEDSMQTMVRRELAVHEDRAVRELVARAFLIPVVRRGILHSGHLAVLAAEQERTDSQALREMAEGAIRLINQASASHWPVLALAPPGSVMPVVLPAFMAVFAHPLIILTILIAVFLFLTLRKAFSARPRLAAAAVVTLIAIVILANLASTPVIFASLGMLAIDPLADIPNETFFRQLIAQLEVTPGPERAALAGELLYQRFDAIRKGEVLEVPDPTQLDEQLLTPLQALGLDLTRMSEVIATYDTAATDTEAEPVEPGLAAAAAEAAVDPVTNLLEEIAGFVLAQGQLKVFDIDFAKMTEEEIARYLVVELGKRRFQADGFMPSRSLIEEEIIGPLNKAGKNLALILETIRAMTQDKVALAEEATALSEVVFMLTEELVAQRAARAYNFRGLDARGAARFLIRHLDIPENPVDAEQREYVSVLPSRERMNDICEELISAGIGLADVVREILLINAEMTGRKAQLQGVLGRLKKATAEARPLLINEAIEVITNPDQVATVSLDELIERFADPTLSIADLRVTEEESLAKRDMEPKGTQEGLLPCPLSRRNGNNPLRTMVDYLEERIRAASRPQDIEVIEGDEQAVARFFLRRFGSEISVGVPSRQEMEDLYIRPLAQRGLDLRRIVEWLIILNARITKRTEEAQAGVAELAGLRGGLRRMKLDRLLTITTTAADESPIPSPLTEEKERLEGATQASAIELADGFRLNPLRTLIELLETNADINEGVPFEEFTQAAEAAARAGSFFSEDDFEALMATAESGEMYQTFRWVGEKLQRGQGVDIHQVRNLVYMGRGRAIRSEEGSLLGVLLVRKESESALGLISAEPFLAAAIIIGIIICGLIARSLRKTIPAAAAGVIGLGCLGALGLGIAMPIFGGIDNSGCVSKPAAEVISDAWLRIARLGDIGELQAMDKFAFAQALGARDVGGVYDQLADLMPMIVPPVFLIDTQLWRRISEERQEGVRMQGDYLQHHYIYMITPAIDGPGVYYSRALVATYERFTDNDIKGVFAHEYFEQALEGAGLVNSDCAVHLGHAGVEVVKADLQFLVLMGLTHDRDSRVTILQDKLPQAYADIGRDREGPYAVFQRKEGVLQEVKALIQQAGSAEFKVEAERLWREKRDKVRGANGISAAQNPEPCPALPYAQAVPRKAHQEAQAQFGKDATVTFSRFKMRGEQYLARAQKEFLFKTGWKGALIFALGLLANIAVRSPPEFTLIVTTDVRKLGRDPKTKQPYVASCDIGQKIVYLHPHFFSLSHREQVKILYHN
jgi:hypothetical protein